MLRVFISRLESTVAEKAEIKREISRLGRELHPEYMNAYDRGRKDDMRQQWSKAFAKLTMLDEKLKGMARDINARVMELIQM